MWLIVESLCEELNLASLLEVKMNYLFWNTNRNKINDYIMQVAVNYSCDVLVMAEYQDNIFELLRMLGEHGINLYQVDKIGCRIDILTKFKPGEIKHCSECEYYTIKMIPHETLGSHYIAFVHFPSKLFTFDDIGFIEQSRLLIQDLNKASKELKNSLIIGDFNMNPFERGMVAASAMHAIPSSDVARRYSRIIKDNEYSMFYNPMWNLYGDFDGTPGTYFYRNSDYVCYFWNIFDQVIIHPSLIDNFDKKSLKIIKGINNTNFINKKGIPNKSISDHLPIFFKIS